MPFSMVNFNEPRTWICMECERRPKGSKRKVLNSWNMVTRKLVIAATKEVVKEVVIGILCPSCQTPAKNAEAEVNLATLDYSGKRNANGFLELNTKPKTFFGGEAATEEN